jgi:hypothetical protein
VRFAGGDDNGDLIGTRFEGVVGAPLVRDKGDVRHALLALDGGHHLGSVRHLGDRLRVHEGNGLDAGEPGLAEAVDESDLLLKGDDGGLVL